MTPKQFAALAAAAAVSLVLALIVHAARAPWTMAPGTEKLMPSLAADLNKVARITITQGEDTLTLERAGDDWQLKSQGGYPASVEKVRGLVRSLAGATLLAPKTRKPEHYAALEVDDPTGKHTRARLVRLAAQDDTLIGEVIAGKTKPSAGTGAGAETYVRRPGDAQSWLASTEIAGDTTLKSWAEPRVFETKTETIGTLTVEIPGEAAYTIARGTDGAHELKDIPAGKKIKYVNMVDNIVEAASFLDLENVRKATGATGGEAGTLRFETDPGLKIALTIRRENNAIWMSVTATGEGEAKATAEQITARTKGWEFALTPSKADTMLKKRDDLLEDAAS